MVFFMQLIESFKEYLELEKKYSQHTVSGYTKDVIAFVTYAQENFEVVNSAEIQYPIIRSWIIQLSERGIDAVSINRKVASLKSFFKYLMKCKQIETNPLLQHKALKTQKKVRSSPTRLNKIRGSICFTTTTTTTATTTTTTTINAAGHWVRQCDRTILSPPH